MTRAWILAALLTAACAGSSSTAPSPSPQPTPAPIPVPAPVPVPLPVRGPDFSPIFWNEFVFNGFESPSALQPLRRLTSAPMLYLKTVDEAGQAIDAVTLQTVEDAMRGVAPTWGGGQFGLAGVQRGTGTMEGQRGWLTVKWPNPSAGAFCGESQIGTDGGWIRLNYLGNVNCSCGGASRIYPRAARHELGHAFGYYHTDSSSDVMKGGSIASNLCDAQPSPRELYHATIAYQSPVGSTTALPLLAGAAPVVVD